MPLSDAQIERYSRQIIVPRVGGVAQERVLRSRLLLAGAHDDIAEPLAYMVGAGVGEVRLMTPDGAGNAERLCREMRDLNPESAVLPSWTPGNAADLALALAGSEAVLEAVRAQPAFTGPSIVARMDSPGKIAVLPAPPPCIRCAPADMLAPLGARSELAGFIAMLATAEAFKILAGYEPRSGTSIIELRGYQTAIRPVSAPNRAPRCACSTRSKG